MSKVLIGNIKGPKGADGHTPVKGVDYFDGVDGYTPRKGVDYFDGKDGKDGATGPAYTLTDADKNTIAAAVRSTMTAADIGAGTFAGQVVANASGQAAGTSCLRNSKLVSTDTNPTVNGEIYWTYG